MATSIIVDLFNFNFIAIMIIITTIKVVIIKLNFMVKAPKKMHCYSTS